jgi:cytochrome c oxidase subunit 4
MTDHAHSQDPHNQHLGYEGYPVAHEDHGIGKYLAVFAALCVLTGCSFFTYSDFWRHNMPVGVGWVFMMGVSCAKALLVILFFMHLKYEADWKYVLTIPASIMALFLCFALVPDVGLRVRHYSEERREHVGTMEDTHLLEAASAAEQQADHGAGGHGAPAHGH